MDKWRENNKFLFSQKNPLCSFVLISYSWNQKIFYNTILNEYFNTHHCFGFTKKKTIQYLKVDKNTKEEIETVVWSHQWLIFFLVESRLNFMLSFHQFHISEKIQSLMNSFFFSFCHFWYFINAYSRKKRMSKRQIYLERSKKTFESKYRNHFLLLMMYRNKLPDWRHTESTRLQFGRC